MNPKVIKTEGEYEAALARMEALWDAAPGSPEGDEAELWTLLIENYEKAEYPIAAPSPVAAIQFRMEQEGLRAKDLVPYFGSAGKVSDVLNGRRSLSLNMIRALHRGLGIPYEILMGGEKPELVEEVPGIVWERFPAAEMVKRGWFEDFKGTWREAKEHMERMVRTMVPECYLTDLQPAMLRQKVRTGSQVDGYALLAWQLRAHALCEREELPEYEAETVNEDFMRDVTRMSSLPLGPKRVKEYLNQYGIHLVLEPHLQGTHLDGAAMWHGGRPVVGLTLRHDRLDNFWFTLQHELAHLALHLKTERGDVFLDDLECRDGDEMEQEADGLASDSLIPAEEWEGWFRGEAPDREEVKAFARSLRVHPAIVAGRIRKELNDYRVLPGFVRGSVREMLGVES